MTEDEVCTVSQRQRKVKYLGLIAIYSSYNIGCMPAR